jgi:hypothetical protein
VCAFYPTGSAGQMTVHMTKPWDQMDLTEKVDHLKALLDDFIAFQNGANARITSRIKYLEDALERVEKSQSESEPLYGA